jgi:Cu(I)/Ag(I) efflux system membrane protein CusA/SilA
LLLWHLRSAALVSALLPLAVLMCFIGMYWFGVDANIVALSGIAIAIGTLADMGIVVSENILKHLEAADPTESRLEVIYRGASEVGSAVLTAVATTVVSFLPVFTMEGAEGKLFKPLAYTKTFALIAAIIVTLTVLPAVAHVLLGWSPKLPRVPKRWRTWAPRVANVVLALAIARWLSTHWEPLGVEAGWLNLVFVVVVIGALLGTLALFIRGYGVVLRWCLDHKILFSTAPVAILIVGAAAWSGLGKEFMPSLDEGSFLYMPTTMPHASIGESMDVLRKQDLAIRAIPEVEQVVGKIGRVESPLDPAPISMVETIISYRPEYGLDADGNRVRQWRDHIRRPDDIWNEIVMAAQVPGSTAAPKLQPIETRLVMLQTGMRAPMGVKVYGPDNETIQAVGFELERLLKEVPELSPAAILADRIVGKPYLEIVWDRAALARYGLTMRAVQDVVEVAIGGRRVTSTVEGRERYPVRVRYPRERRDSIESLAEIIVPAPDGTQIPLGELAEVIYTPGPMVIKSEDTFLVGYVILDRADGVAEVDAVEAASAYLDKKKANGELVVPDGVHWKFSGSYENQIRAERRLAVILPLALGVIFLLLYLQFRRVTTAMLVFSGVFVAWAGGFILLWCYGQDWFLAGGWFGVDWRTLFQVGPLNLSVAVWVGFLALFGIITDDGVVIGTYLHQSFDRQNPQSIAEFRAATLTAGLRRVRPCMMITGTSILALLPVLTATGRGADVMRPMAVPAFGGMIIEVISMFIVPVVFCLIAEFRHRTRWSAGATDSAFLLTGGLVVVPMLLWCGISDWMDSSDAGRVEGPPA